ncbi:MAG: VanZ family protein [Pleurocapsa sp. MO_226.B13]|nr:VanZ family protein [Pleurocapsa sp. MO_226.B13]
MNPSGSLKGWGYFLLTISLLGIFAATLSPLDFVVPEELSWQFIVDEFKFGSNVKDYWQNILLFIPWGFGLAAIVFSKRQQVGKILAIAFLSSAILATTVELTQLFLPSRISNWTDIICNSLGGCLGGIIYWNYPHILKFVIAIVTGKIGQISIKSILFVIFGYLLVVSLGISLLLTSVNLSNWDDDYYLAIGNEVTGDRPWHGDLQSLYVSDRSLNYLEVNRAFEQTDAFFKQQDNLVMALDLRRDRQLSGSIWEQKPEREISNHAVESTTTKINLDSPRETRNSIILNRKRWLKTQVPVNYLIESLKNSNEFTISLTIATKDINQVGPARIISLAQGIYAQNLIVGQEKNDLHFRLRTPITGRNATHPELIVPNVFQDKLFHQILITFGDRQLTFYLDRPSNRYSFLFNPQISFVIFIPWNQPGWQINLGNFSAVKYQLIFYTVITLPLVFLMVILSWRMIVKP